MNRLTVSAVMPNYNHAHFLPRSIRAIAEQSRPPDEFLILDDASTDNSVEVITRFARQYPFIRLLRHEQNQGVNASNRRLFEAARGAYIHAAAADDDRHPEFLEAAMEMAERHPQAGLVFGRLIVKDATGREIGRVDVRRWPTAGYYSPEQFLHEYLDGELASHSASGATLYRADAFAEVGWYREDLGSWADTFAARAIGLKYGACFVPRVFATDYRHPGSYSQQTKDDPRRALALIARAAAAMRSEPFRDRFPEAHVRRWERQFRRLVAWNYLLGSPSPQVRPSFLRRNLARLPRLPGTLALLWSRGATESPD